MSKERAAQLVDAGIWLKLSGDREGARKLFERALKLDPENQKAAQLLAGGDEPTAAPMPADLPAAPSIAPLTDAGGNPFEPPAASPPSPTQRDWNLATSKGVPSQPEPSLDADWGRLTGASTPVPQPPPPGTEAPPAPRNTLPFGSNQSGLNVVIGSNTPAPAPPPQTSSPSSPRNPTMMQWNSPVPQPGPMKFDSPPPIAPVVPPASSGSSPGLKRPTMSDWGTQVGGSSDSPPPIAPVIPRSSGSSPGVQSSPSRQTISEWGDAPRSSGSGLKQPPARQTMSEWGDAPAPPVAAPKSSGSSPGKARQTMSDWGTQVGGGFDSPPPIKPVLPVEELPAPPQAEVARSTLHEWSGSSSSSLAMKPIFSGPASTDSQPLMSPEGGLTVSIGGQAPPEIPPPSTPPLFGSSADDPPTPAQMDELPLPAPARLDAPPMTEIPRTFTEPMGFAWSWSASQSPPPGALPEPRPSPSLAPRAESAWDQRSNPGIKLEAVVGRDKALDLISSDSKPNRAAPTKKEEVSAILRGAKDLLELDDHTGAMELIQKAESIAPDDPEVIGMRERSEKTLLTMFESKLGKLEAVPRVLLKDDEIIWLNLDHRAGFVLAQIDGTVSFDDLFSVSGMTRIDTARILAQLVEEGVISRG